MSFISGHPESSMVVQRTGDITIELSGGYQVPQVHNALIVIGAHALLVQDGAY